MTPLAVGSAKGKPEELRRPMKLEWDTVDGATQYEIEITKLGQARKAPMLFKVELPRWSAKLSFGKYQMRLRSYDLRNLPGPWSAATEFLVKSESPRLISPADNKVIPGAAEEKSDVQFEWEKSIGAQKYRIEIVDDQNRTVIKDVVNRTRVIKSLDVAKKYVWSVTSIMESGEDGEPPKGVGRFTLNGKKLDAPNIESPTTGFVRELRWDPSEHAQFYSYKLLLKSKNKKWKKMLQEDHSEKTEIPFDSAYPAGRYRLVVQAKALLWADSPKSTIDFSVASDRSPAAEQASVLRAVIDLQTPFYFFASYLITQMNYNGNFPERNTDAQYATLGGTGTLGLAYYPNRGNLGYFGLVDLSGFLFQGRNVTFSATEHHLIWKTFLGDASQVRVSGGLFYKELPLVQGDAYQNNFSLGRIGSAGPHLGGEYWWSISQNLGFQVNARVYQSAIKGETPNGKDIKPTTSFQAGFMGTLKLTSAISGLMGYAYRLDAGAYQATSSSEDSASYAQEGDANRVRIEGHYLNLRLEWGF